MDKKMRTYRMDLEKDGKYCTQCKVKLVPGEKIDGIFCPNCGTIFPYFKGYLKHKEWKKKN